MQKIEVVILGALGKMGQTLLELVQNDPDLILKAVLEKSEQIKDLKDLQCVQSSDPEEAMAGLNNGVIVDFSSPEATMQALAPARKNKVPMVSGTTGFNKDQQQELQSAARQIPIFWAPNMSVGINVLLKALPELSSLLGEAYDLEISEIHHRFKKDAPSGTAVKLAQELARERGWDEQCLRFARQGIIGQRSREEIGVQALRGGDVVGEHTIYFFGPGERIDVTHRVNSRVTFAQGALRAAKWIVTQEPGKLYAMSDMLSK